MSFVSNCSPIRRALSSFLKFKRRTPSLATHSRHLHPLAPDWSGLVGHAPPVTANLVPIVIEQTVSVLIWCNYASLHLLVSCREEERGVMTYSRVCYESV